MFIRILFIHKFLEHAKVGGFKIFCIHKITKFKEKHAENNKTLLINANLIQISIYYYKWKQKVKRLVKDLKKSISLTVIFKKSTN